MRGEVQNSSNKKRERNAHVAFCLNYIM